MNPATAPITFRVATVADLPFIVALLADDTLGAQREAGASGTSTTALDPRYLAAFNAIEADANQQLVVAQQDDQVVGTLQLSFIPGLSRSGSWRGQIEAVRIAAHLRGSGAGQQMFAWAIEQCRLRGCQLVQLTTDKQRPDAHRFYEKLGFVHVDKPLGNTGHSAACEIYMHKKI